jgi:transcriptional regulator with XRE-family HTH domain
MGVTTSDFPNTIRTLGQAIRHLREAQDLSLRSLARKVGVSAPFLSDLERDRRSTERLEEIASALGVTLDDLEDFDTRIPPDLKLWIESMPGIAKLLKEMKASGRTVTELRQALHDGEAEK